MEESMRKMLGEDRVKGAEMFRMLLHSMFRKEYVKLILALSCASLDLCKMCPTDENGCPQRELADEFNALAAFLGVEVIVKKAGEDDTANERSD